VADKSGKNIFFPQHGGNRISKISIDSGIMTEYDIPTGPLSTALFIAASDDGKKVWFTEYASNKVAYLDNTIPVPLNLRINSIDDTPIILRRNEPKTLDVLLNTDDKNYSSSNSVSLSEVELAIVGMSDSGLRGITYDPQPQRVNLENNSVVTSQINLNAEEDNDNNRARPDNYTIMVKASVPEKNSTLSFVSLLYPVAVTLDIPTVAVANTSQQQTSVEDKSSQQTSVFSNDTIVRDLARIISLSTAIALIGYIVYRRIKRSKRSPEQQQ
jgi:hypothetical protein